ncbi:hypothetical protein BO99DRAFT_267847 [Aspergillus violaceofuscus CBS 115571]|uniref:Uncharacterized protein n=1 Tax=Aspergillus violaceofuscus (strain CBS 115571) TaxID=1450538 RepID=A0A2V5GV74_ASPV1|nr:hypothetical protein BO99DRAFT_267847 [Aspergillus violaceofuscus CBS 115571]
MYCVLCTAYKNAMRGFFVGVSIWALVWFWISELGGRIWFDAREKTIDLCFCLVGSCESSGGKGSERTVCLVCRLRSERGGSFVGLFGLELHVDVRTTVDTTTRSQVYR